MDTSETWKKMCAKAEEVQAKRPSGTDEHDYFWSPVHGNGLDLERAVWLPRQDQLQEMVKIDNLEEFLREIVWSMLSSGGNGEGWYFGLPDWAKTDGWKIKEGKREYSVLNKKLQFTSMEQLWLAFHMKSEHNKTWDGDKWVKDI